jgi:hypothetical protein
MTPSFQYIAPCKSTAAARCNLARKTAKIEAPQKDNVVNLPKKSWPKSGIVSYEFL